MAANGKDHVSGAANDCRLDIIVVGGGMGGLAASIQCALSGHHVTVIEAAQELAEVRCNEGCTYPKAFPIMMLLTSSDNNNRPVQGSR